LQRRLGSMAARLSSMGTASHCRRRRAPRRPIPLRYAGLRRLALRPPSPPPPSSTQRHPLAPYRFNPSPFHTRLRLCHSKHRRCSTMLPRR
jgi:hypothetical protein